MTIFLITWLTGWVASAVLQSVWMIMVMTRMTRINVHDVTFEQWMRLVNVRMLWEVNDNISMRSGLVTGIIVGNFRSLLLVWPLWLLSLTVHRKGR